MTIRLSLWTVLLAQATLLAGCGGGADNQPAGDQDGTMDHGVCEPLTNRQCIEIQRGEAVFHRWLVDYDSFSYDSQYNGTIEVISVAELIDIKVTDDPSAYRYQIYGTDGFTFGGFASLANMENAYMEVSTRLTVFDESQQLPHSFNVKDSYLIVLAPAGG